MPCASRETIENEHEKLESNGEIVKTERSELATPVVVVPKSDKMVRFHVVSGD